MIACSLAIAFLTITSVTVTVAEKCSLRVVKAIPETVTALGDTCFDETIHSTSMDFPWDLTADNIPIVVQDDTCKRWYAGYTAAIKSVDPPCHYEAGSFLAKVYAGSTADWNYSLQECLEHLMHAAHDRSKVYSYVATD
ncbi:Aste57867_16197 [Aphanomyces stellatus]|uniref:Aste57867_16197 protein n=1 Tax=Aphanomyces stellatus TaxID=120398 RepID=A0A485L5W9_9STRA|nr:hypothetical protein As57867_016141 [Aphanomyces stellatus]VFT92975.1 Aste57867_16197 [Aphanomyces stellatus]